MPHLVDQCHLDDASRRHEEPKGCEESPHSLVETGVRPQEGRQYEPRCKSIKKPEHFRKRDGSADLQSSALAFVEEKRRYH